MLNYIKNNPTITSALDTLGRIASEVKNTLKDLIKSVRAAAPMLISAGTQSLLSAAGSAPTQNNIDSLVNSAANHEKSGNHSMAFNAYSDALSSHQSLNGKGSAPPELLNAVVTSATGSIATALENGDGVSAAGTLEKAVNLLDAEINQPATESATSAQQVKANLRDKVGTKLADLGFILYQQGDYQNAREYYQQALNIHTSFGDNNIGSNDTDIATISQFLGTASLELGDYDAAQKPLENSYNMALEKFGENHETTVTRRNKLARLNLEQGKFKEAEGLIKTNLEWERKTYGEDHIDTTTSLGNLVIALRGQGNLSEAMQQAQKAYDIQLGYHGENHLATADSAMALGAVHFSQENYAAAKHLVDQAVATYEEHLGGEHPAVQHMKSNQAKLNEKLA